jgi:hypothetical protein
VSSEKSAWPGVSSRFTWRPWYSNWRTLEVTEIPRSCSIFIQSLVAWRCERRAFTLPARWMAPPYRRSFSVSVVFPASGCEIMAKVRRRRTSSDSPGISLPCSSGRDSSRDLSFHNIGI